MFELRKNKDSIRLGVISDLHLGNINDRVDLLHLAYDYAKDNHIRYVINLGDNIENVMPHDKNDLKINTVEKQIDYLIDVYPKDNNIKSLVLYGNHDYYSKYLGGIDVAKEISSRRKDLYNLGYGESYIRIADNFIKLGHDISYIKDYKLNVSTYLTFLGHIHSYRIKSTDDSIVVAVPSLSDVSPSKDINIPGLLDVEISFYREMISVVSIKNIDLERNIITSSVEHSLNVNPKKFMKIKDSFIK